MTNNENLIPIPGRLHSVATEGHVAGADEIYDDALQKDQATINQEVSEALGKGGTVDEKIVAAINALDATKSQTAGADGLALSVTEEDGKITSISGSIAPNTYDASGAAATAKAEVIGGATSSGNTLKKLEDRVSPLETAVGNGGSVDTRISNAVATETTRAQGAEFTLQTNIDVEATRAQEAEANRYTKSETYTKEEVNNLITTPSQKYVSVTATAQTTAATDVLPATGSADTIYRVGNWDGSQYNTGAYTEYAWNGSNYILLSKKQSGIDDMPTANSDNLVKSGGVYAKIKSLEDAGYVFAGIATPTTNPGTPDQNVFYLAGQGGTYTNFGNIELQNGLSVLILNDSSWSGQQILSADDVPTAGSNNLVKSGGVYKKIGNIVSKDGPFSITDENGYIGVIIDNNGMSVKDVCIKINGSFSSVKDLISQISQSLTETDEEVGDINTFLTNSFKEAENFYLTDENGYIAFMIDRKGNVIDTRGDSSSFCEKIVFRGTEYTPNQRTITIPQSDVQIPYSGRLELPSKINVLQNSIAEIYFEQMLGGGFLRDYMISYGVAAPYQRQCDRAFISTNTIGETEHSLYLWNTFGSKIEEKNMQVCVVNKNVSGNIKICVIGDSMTDNAKKLYELANLADNDNYFTISFLGARAATGTDSEGNTRTVKHCGYSGRNIVDFCQSATLNNYSNPFYDANIEGTNKFSIAKGIENMGDVPDIVIIDHGANQSVVAWATVKGCYDFIISDISAYNTANNTDIKVVICVQQPGGLSEKVVPNVPNKWSRTFSPTKLMNYINEYDGREDEGIYLLPQYLFIDPYKDYPRADVPYSTRNTSLREVSLDNTHMGINMNGYNESHTYSYGDICTDGNQNGYVSLKNNNTEPLSDDKINWAKTKDDVNAGYWKLADAYFAELKYIESLNN